MSTESGQSLGKSPGKAMFVEFESHGDALIARLACTTVGQREAEVLLQAITNELQQQDGARPVRTLVVDCSQVTFINSTGLGCFINLNTSMRERKGQVALYGLRDELLQVFKMTKIDRLFTIVSNERKLKKLIGA